jgi:hypothetical protein
MSESVKNNSKMNEDSGEIAQRLAKLLLDQAVVLFAGAGCSAQIKIPIWDAYLETLAAKAEEYEPEIAVLMRKRLKAQSYLEAATLFKRTLIAPPGDKFKAMSEPFRPGSYDYTPLLPLASLPFSAMMTTNYDSSLFEGWNEIANQRSSLRPQLLARKNTKGAAYISEPFFFFSTDKGVYLFKLRTWCLTRRTTNSAIRILNSQMGYLRSFQHGRACSWAFPSAIPESTQY